MKKSHKTIVALALSLAVVLALGVGLASAQAPDEAAPPAEGECTAGGGGHGGPGGPGGRGIGGGGLMVGGEVVSVDGDTITLTTPRGEEQRVKVTEETVYRKKDGDASLVDVVPGERIGVKLTAVPEEGKDAVAETVMIGEPGGMRHRPTVGEVTAVDGNNVTIATEDGEQTFTLPSVETGQRLGIAADEDGNVRALMYDPPERPAPPAGDAAPAA